MTYTEPLLTGILLAGFVGLLLLPRTVENRVARRWLVIATAGLFAISWPPVDWAFAQVLEWPYRQSGMPSEDAQAIVVLSSYVQPPSRETPVPIPDKMTYGRCRFGAWLYRNWKAVPVFVSGGPVKETSIGREMARLLETEGIPGTAISREEKSRNTHENAVFTTAMLRSRGIHRIVLVTEAESMLRAERCFRREGVEVVTAPYEKRVLRLETLDDVLPGWKSIERNERVLHECIGLMWYKLRGWI